MPRLTLANALLLVKTKGLISCTVFAYAKSRFSHATAHFSKCSAFVSVFTGEDHDVFFFFSVNKFYSSFNI